MSTSTLPLTFTAGSLLKGNLFTSSFPFESLGAMLVVWVNRDTMFTRSGAATEVIPGSTGSS